MTTDQQLKQLNADRQKFLSSLTKLEKVVVLLTLRVKTLELENIRLKGIVSRSSTHLNTLDAKMSSR